MQQVARAWCRGAKGGGRRDRAALEKWYGMCIIHVESICRGPGVQGWGPGAGPGCGGRGGDLAPSTALEHPKITCPIHTSTVTPRAPQVLVCATCAGVTGVLACHHAITPHHAITHTRTPSRMTLSVSRLFIPIPATTSLHTLPPHAPQVLVRVTYAGIKGTPHLLPSIQQHPVSRPPAQHMQVFSHFAASLKCWSVPPLLTCLHAVPPTTHTRTHIRTPRPSGAGACDLRGRQRRLRNVQGAGRVRLCSQPGTEGADAGMAEKHMYQSIAAKMLCYICGCVAGCRVRLGRQQGTAGEVACIA